MRRLWIIWINVKTLPLGFPKPHAGSIYEEKTGCAGVVCFPKFSNQQAQGYFRVTSANHQKPIKIAGTSDNV